MLVLPLLFLFQTAMNLGFALLFSTLTVYFKDVSNLLNYILRILMFATPVVYPVATLPPNVQRLLIWNPLFPLFSAYQAIITGQMPSGGQILACTFWSVVLVVVGAWSFLRYERVVRSPCLTRPTDTHLPSRRIDVSASYRVRGTPARAACGACVPSPPEATPRCARYRRCATSRSTVPKGSVLGVIGRNGAGKSTLLRTVSGILAPKEGRVVVRGRISPLLSVGLGMHPELSGRENVRLGCLAFGHPPETVERPERVDHRVRATRRVPRLSRSRRTRVA